MSYLQTAQEFDVAKKATLLFATQGLLTVESE
jgi:hypothetical protein